MVKNIGTPALLSDNAPFSQKIVAITNALGFTFLFLLFALGKNAKIMRKKARSDSTQNSKNDWTK